MFTISLQVRIKVRNAIESTLNCCKHQVIFKNERKLSDIFRFKDRVPYDLVSGVVYECTCDRWNSSYYGETERHLKVRSGEHIGISLLTFKKTKPSKDSWICDDLLQCDNWCVHTCLLENSLSCFYCIVFLKSFVRVTFSYFLYGFSNNIGIGIK